MVNISLRLLNALTYQLLCGSITKARREVAADGSFAITHGR